MALLVRIYFNAVFGALGGLLGWLLYALFYDEALAEVARWLIGGAFIGGSIGYCVVSVEAARDLALLRFCRLASYGLLVSAVGGALGMLAGEALNQYLINQIGPPRDWQWYHVALFMAARGLSFCCVGLAVGLGEGAAAKSVGRTSYGSLGGAVGGFVGGALFGLFYYLARMRGGVEDAGVLSHLFGALGLVILGACIGSFSALVQGVFQPARLRVVRGWQEGREYPLEKPQCSVGRDEHADIALFRDMRIERKHAVIQREANRYILVNVGGSPEQTQVNGEPVPYTRDLLDGDRIQLGGVVLHFLTRSNKDGLPTPGGKRHNV